MKSSEDHPTPVDAPADGEDEATGLPGVHTWRGVYALVFGCFILWVLLLLALTVSFP
jgi:hypothetical protein